MIPDNKEKRDWLQSVISDFYTFVTAMTIIIACLICCTSCASHRPAAIRHTSGDTAYIERTRLDTLLCRDSIYICTAVRGDTVYSTKYVDRWRERVRHSTDTVYVTRTRLTEIPAPSERPSAPWYARWLSPILPWFLRVALVIIIIYVAGYIWLRHRKT